MDVEIATSVASTSSDISSRATENGTALDLHVSDDDAILNGTRAPGEFKNFRITNDAVKAPVSPSQSILSNVNKFHASVAKVRKNEKKPIGGILEAAKVNQHGTFQSSATEYSAGLSDNSQYNEQNIHSVILSLMHSVIHSEI